MLRAAVSSSRRAWVWHTKWGPATRNQSTSLSAGTIRFRPSASAIVKSMPSPSEKKTISIAGSRRSKRPASASASSSAWPRRMSATSGDGSSATSSDSGACTDRTPMPSRSMLNGKSPPSVSGVSINSRTPGPPGAMGSRRSSGSSSWVFVTMNIFRRVIISHRQRKTDAGAQDQAARGVGRNRFPRDQRVAQFRLRRLRNQHRASRVRDFRDGVFRFVAQP